MRNTKRLAGLAAIAITAIFCSASPMWGQDIRLQARKNKVIDGIEAQLRGDYRESNGTPMRLNADLENINLPVGTPVAFCLVQKTFKMGWLSVRALLMASAGKKLPRTVDTGVVFVTAANVATYVDEMRSEVTRTAAR